MIMKSVFKSFMQNWLDETSDTMWSDFSSFIKLVVKTPAFLLSKD